MFEPYVTALLWFEKAPELDAITAAFEKYAWPCFRFHSCIEGNKWIRRHEMMDIAYHFEEKHMDDESDIDKFAMMTQLSALDDSYPRWKVFILHVHSGRAAVCLHIHHSIGDGLGLLFALSPMIGVEGGNPLATVPLPNSVLPPSVRNAKRVAKAAAVTKEETDRASCCEEDKSLFDPGLTNAASDAEQAANGQAQADAVQATQTASANDEATSAPQRKSMLSRLDMGMTSSIRSYMRGAFTPLATGYDSELTINEPLSKRKPYLPFNGNRAFTRFPPVPMAAVKAVREKYGCSMNDAVMGAIAGALRRYAIEVKDDQVLEANGKSVECKSMVMLALPRPVDEDNLTSALCNKMLFASLGMPVGEPSPEKRMERIVLGCNNLKSKSYMSGLVGFTNFITKVAPKKILNKAAAETFSKHSLLVTNVPATAVPATWPAEGGSPIQAMSVVIANVMPQISMISYNGDVHASIVADPDLIPDAGKLGQFFLEEFDILAFGTVSATPGRSAAESSTCDAIEEVKLAEEPKAEEPKEEESKVEKPAKWKESRQMSFGLHWKRRHESNAELVTAGGVEAGER